MCMVSLFLMLVVVIAIQKHNTSISFFEPEVNLCIEKVRLVSNTLKNRQQEAYEAF